MNTVIVNPKRFVLILTVVLLTYGAHGISYGDELTSEEIAKIALDSTVLLTTESSRGSGFFVSDGLIATNYHVIEGSTRITARLVGAPQEYDVEAIWAIDVEHDLAIVTVTGMDAPTLRLGDSDAVEIGQTIYVAGNPLGLVGTFSTGNISRLEEKRIQMTAPISPGNSGGPVLNSYGEVIGISVEYYEEGQNLNFAIPVNFLKRLLQETAAYLRIDKVYNLYFGSVSVAFSPDGRYIATGDTDGDVGLWEVGSGDNKYYQHLGGEVKSVAFSPNGGYIAGGGSNGDPYVALLEVRRLTAVNRKEVPNASQVYDVAFSPNGRYVAIGVNRPGVWLWDVNGDRWKGWRVRDTSEVYAVAFSPNGSYLATGNDDGGVPLWELSSWWTDDVNVLQDMKPGENVRAIAFSPSGRYLAVDGYNSSSHNVSIYDVTSGKIVRRIDSGDVRAIAFSPSGKYLTIGDNDGRITFYQFGQFGANITQAGVISASGKVTDLAWSPDGTLISDGREVWQITRVHGALPVRLSSVPIDTVNVGDRFTLEFRVEDVTDLAGWQLAVTFNHTVLQAVSVDEGNFLKKDGGRPYFSAGNINNATGEISGVTATHIGTGGVSGDGGLLSLTFKAKASGMGWLTLHNVQFVDSSGKAMRHEITTINPVIVGDGYLSSDVNQDGEVDLLDLIWISQNFGPTYRVIERADVNGDGTVDIFDLMIVAQDLGESTNPAAPIASLPFSERLSNFNQDTIQEWIDLAHAADDGSLTFRQGITYLKRLLAAILPDKTALLPNYPNPFNPETWIPYQLSEDSAVSISIYDTAGKLVRTLSLGFQSAGFYNSRDRAAYWDGRNNIGEHVASGNYYYQLTTPSFRQTRRLVILK